MVLPFLAVAEPDLGPLEEQYVLEAIRSGWISSMGEFIGRFEREFAKLCGVDHCVALANGTVALHIALAARGIGPGDEVVVPDLTFVASGASVLHAGATPVLVDVDRRSMCIDPELVERAITPKTKAIMPVHLYGHPSAMVELRVIAERKGLFLLEDAAEAHGARVSGRRVGGLGDAACFSFYGNKIITTGEGGCVTTNDAAFAARVRFLKDHAMSSERRYFHPEVGFNYRMTNLQAAVGCAQLERFDELLAKKARLLALYRAAFDGTDITINPTTAGADPVCWLVTALLPGTWTVERQAALAAALRTESAVDVRPFFVPMHQLPPYRNCRLVKRDASVSDHLATHGVCLPSSNRLSEEDVRRVSDAVKRFLAS